MIEPWVFVAIAAIAFALLGRWLRTPRQPLYRPRGPRDDTGSPDASPDDSVAAEKAEDVSEDTPARRRPTYGAARYRTKRD
ncbi:MAG: hypothetical protein CMH12_17805 [Maritimibacter sp.]|nr:hypothetical protein [Maritimibacter sp.]